MLGLAHLCSSLLLCFSFVSAVYSPRLLHVHEGYVNSVPVICRQQRAAFIPRPPPENQTGQVWASLPPVVQSAVARMVLQLSPLFPLQSIFITPNRNLLTSSQVSVFLSLSLTTNNLLCFYWVAYPKHFLEIEFMVVFVSDFQGSSMA